ncbi:MAG: UDP-phosphate alpha-N-acetyl-D-fucosaminephosphotransferase [Microbacteriaceae bacterium]|nr:UDP-phosphate alpha-N-acetyl-D-fucosaminephosphotransferase [Microbacteriaceae bacterium]
MPVLQIFAALAVTLVASLLVPLVLRPILIARGAYDVANERSSHAGAVVRGLGLGVWLALAAGWLVLLLGGPLAPEVRPLAWGLFAAFNFAALIGAFEDLRGLSVVARSVAQLAFAGLVLWQVLSHFGAGLAVWQLALWVVFGIFFISSYVNVANFMDGLNGMSALHGIVAGLAFIAAGFLAGHVWLSLAGALLALAFFGFLPWNLAGRGFLGDVGSYLLGGAVVSLSFAALLAGVLPLAAIGPTVVYFGDVGWTLLKRRRQGKKWSQPHKEHVYQRLQQSGFSHFAVSLIMAGFTLFASLLGLASYLWPSLLGQAVLLVAGFAVVVLYVNLPRLLHKN